MIIPRVPLFYQDPVVGKFPAIFARPEAVDGAVSPWLESPIGSLCIRSDAGNVTIYVKKTDNGATGDWVAVTTA